MKDDDLVKGHIIIKNSKTNEVVVDTHNMFLMDGRKLLLALFINKIMCYTDNALLNSEGYKKIEMPNNFDADRGVSLFFGSGTTATTPSYIPTKIVTKKINEKENSINVDINTENIENDRDVYYIHFSTNINKNYLSELGEKTFSEVGLVCNYGNTKNYYISRALFGPLQLEADTEFTFDYYLYF